MAQNRKGKKWDDEEHARLIRELASGVSIAEMAKSHGRTELGIGFRIKKIAVDMTVAGKPMAEIQRATRLTQDEIDEAVGETAQNMEKRDEKNKAREQNRAARKQKIREKLKEENPQMEDLYRVMLEISRKLDTKK